MIDFKFIATGIAFVAVFATGIHLLRESLEPTEPPRSSLTGAAAVAPPAAFGPGVPSAEHALYIGPDFGQTVAAHVWYCQPNGEIFVYGQRPGNVPPVGYVDPMGNRVVRVDPFPPITP